MAKTWMVKDDVRESAVKVLHDDGAHAVVEVDGHAVEVHTTLLPDGRVAISCGDRPAVALRTWRDGKGVWVSSGPRSQVYEVEDEQKRMLGALVGGGGGDGAVKSSMPGSVVRVLIAVGDAVAAGDVVVVLEAMKMENDVKAPVAGVVTEVAVAEGDAVDSDVLLVRIEPES